MELGRLQCDLPCGQSARDQDPSVLEPAEQSDPAAEGMGHLVLVKALDEQSDLEVVGRPYLALVEAWAWAWVLLLGHVAAGSLVVELHKGEGHNLEVRAVLVAE